MKTQEEKIKKAKILYESANADQRYVLESLFPELKESEESEDERISREITEFLVDFNNGEYERPNENTIDSWLSWLEKQGKHQKFRDSIQVGDKVTRNKDGVLVNLSQLNRVAKKQGKQETLCDKCRKEQPSHSCQDITALGRCAVEHEQKPAEFDDANAKRMFIKALERVEEQNNKGYKLTDCDKNSWWEDFKTYCCYIEIQKPAWSEEDELIVAKILCICNDFERSFECSPSSTKVIKEDVDKIDNWLKSIKDKYTWKPSEEQMEALWSATEKYLESDNEYVRKLSGEVLESLYMDLKKLMEE